MYFFSNKRSQTANLNLFVKDEYHYDNNIVDFLEELMDKSSDLLYLKKNTSQQTDISVFAIILNGALILHHNT